MKCPHCGDQHEDDCFCCPNSGKILKLSCVNPDCKKLIDASYSFCPYCGHAVVVQDIEDMMREKQAEEYYELACVPFNPYSGLHSYDHQKSCLYYMECAAKLGHCRALASYCKCLIDASDPTDYMKAYKFYEAFLVKYSNKVFIKSDFLFIYQASTHFVGQSKKLVEMYLQKYPNDAEVAKLQEQSKLNEALSLTKILIKLF